MGQAKSYITDQSFKTKLDIDWDSCIVVAKAKNDYLLTIKESLYSTKESENER